MKTVPIFVFAGLALPAAAQNYLQKTHLSLNLRDVKLSEVFSAIEQKSEYVFIYSENIHSYLGKRVSVDVRSQLLDKILDRVLTPLGLSYNINDRQVTISVGKPAGDRPDGSVTIRGIVIANADNQPIVGANVLVEGTSTGTVTDSYGNYSLTVPGSTKAIRIWFLGYEPKIITLNTADLAPFKVVVLNQVTKDIEDVVVVGFGVQKKESLVGAVQTIRPSELKTTSSNLTTAFAGKIAGVIATQTSGEPGADGASFWIRGISTFGANTSPLIVLDGVEITSEMINNIPPETIESFSVLKDATATALYGSRGANGVLIINTRTGRDADRMHVNIRFENSFSMPTKIQKMADGVTYMRAYNEASPGYYDEEAKILPTLRQENPYVFPNVNWYEMMFKDMSVNQNFNINMTGGSKRMDYFLNASIFNENGIMKEPKISSFDPNTNNQAYLFQANLSAAITRTTRISLKTNTQLKFTHLPYVNTSDLFYYTMRGNPVRYPATYPSESGDNFTRYGNALPFNGGQVDINPYAEMSRGYSDRYLAFFTTAFSVDQDLKFITEGLSAKGMVSFYNKTYSSSNRYFTPFYYTMDSYSKNDDGAYEYELSPIGPNGTTYLTSNFGRDGYREMAIQASVDYTRTFADAHSVNAMLVYHQKERRYTTPSDSSVDSNEKLENKILAYREQGLAGRLTYGFKNRYLMELNFGYNGSDNFAEGKRFGFFPSVAVGYVISNEPYFKKLTDVVSLLKVRVSYGKSGNDIIDNDKRFPYLGSVDMNRSLYHYIGTNFNRVSGPIFTQIGNNDATWEVSKKLNIGVELGLFNDLMLIVDVFREKRSGIFMQYQSVPAQLGFLGLTPYANIGKVDNNGVDASLEYNKAFSKDFSISVRGTFTYAHNEVVAMDEGQYEWPYQSMIGKPINTVKGLVAEGLFSSQEDIDNSPHQDFGDVRPGDIKYRNLNDDDKIDDNDMKAVGRPTVPEIMYGFGATARYKGFDFSFFFQGVGRVSIVMSDMHPFTDNSNAGFNIAQYIVDDHWSEADPNPDAKYPRLSANWNTNNTKSSSFWVRDGSYLRLKNVELGYTWKGFRFYVAGQNLVTFSPFKYWDPELGGETKTNKGNGLRYPLQRIFKLGVQFNF